MGFYNNCTDIGQDKRKVFETVQSSKKILVRDTKYVWIFYRKILSSSLTGLLLYNVTRKCEESNKKIIDDMLKILYAYEIIAKDEFYQGLLKTTKKCQKDETKIEDNLEKLKQVIEQQKFQLPYFICDRLNFLLELVNSTMQSRKSIYENLSTITQITRYIREKDVISAKEFLDFYKGLNKYYTSISDMEMTYEKNKETLKDLKIFANVFSDQISFKYAVELIKQVLLYIEDFKYYNQIPLLSELVSSSFSEKVLKPYKKLVRNKAYKVEV